MAAISSISNGEALSSVRTKLNSVITEVNLLDPTDWIDYSATSTIVGWASFTTKQIRYRVIGKQVFVNVILEGTSNNTATTFTLPTNCVSKTYNTNWAVNNGTSVIGTVQMNVSSNIVTCYQQYTSSWIASGTKYVWCQFFYEIA